MTATAHKVNPLAAVNRVLKHTEIKYLDRARARPFVKWAGGKRTLVPEIVKLLPAKFGHYWEPFVGGGAVFFALDSRIRKAHLSDVNIELILTYRIIHTQSKAMIDALRVHERKHNRRHYLHVRNTMHAEQDPVLLAARFVYLNKTCFNGLYRVNKQGRFNVPYGRYTNPTICDDTNLRAAADVLAKASLTVQSFDRITPKSGDLIYCDPPYDGTFTGYTGDGFTPDDHKALRDACRRWRTGGAHVIISNSDTGLIRRLYKGFTIHKVSAARHINSDGNGRGKTPELLIVG